jgi:arsenate reductase
MKYLFVCYKRCSTCAKARKWLDENGIEYNSALNIKIKKY